MRVSGLLRELSQSKESYPGVVVMPQENRIPALSASSSDSGLGKHLAHEFLLGLGTMSMPLDIDQSYQFLNLSELI